MLLTEYGFIMMPWYVKKEDARKIVKSQRIMVGIILLALAIVNFLMDKILVKRLSEILDLNQASNPWLSVLLLLGSLYVFFQEPDYSKVDKLVKNYKNGEMINTKIIMDWRYEWGGLILALGMVLYLITTIILPIYNLTNSF